MTIEGIFPPEEDSRYARQYRSLLSLRSVVDCTDRCS